MPIYEYKCNACGKDFETLVIGGDVPDCPACSSQDLSRQMSTCGFVSKSSGPSGEVSTTSSAGTSACSSCTAGSCSSCGIG